MAKNSSDILIDTLLDWGVDTVFGLPGDGINGIMEALRQNRDRIRFIHVRHEESAAFMATAYAKFTGRLGVCLATSGPGGIHLLNGLYDAKLDGKPVLAITGETFHDLIHTHQQQDVLLDRLFEDVAVYNERVMGAAHVRNVADLGIRTALSYHGVAHLTFPVDVQETEIDHRSPRNIPDHSSEVYAHSSRLPGETDLRRAAEVLNAGKRIAILAGQGALDATDELEQVAERLGAPIVKALLGKAAVPDESPYTTGGIGLLGTKPSEEVFDHCDTILIVGSSFPYIDFYPKPGQARGVQIELDPARVGLRFPVEVGLVGDSKSSLRALLPLLDAHENRSFLQKAQKDMQDWWRLMDERSSRMDTPMKPQVAANAINHYLTDDAIICTDSGTVTTYAARDIRIRRGQMFSLSGNLATMANGFPYAIAAQVAYPDRQCVALVGDGGFSMLMAEFSTCVKYGLPVKVVVFKNNVLGQIKWEQMVFLGNPQYGVELQPIDFAAFARACGGSGFTLEDPKNAGEVMAQALATPGPVLVEAVVDPNEPPLPATITVDQSKKFAEALARGEPNRGAIIKTVFEDEVRELV